MINRLELNIKRAVVIAVVGFLIYLSTKYISWDEGNGNGSAAADGFYTEWSDWTACSKDCGGGIQSRSREYIQAKNGGLDLENWQDTSLLKEYRNCNDGECPVDGSFSDWSEWSACTKECGGGTQSRERVYNSAKYGGVDLSNEEKVKLLENRLCNPEPCPVDGYFSSWSDWSDCTRECGGGTQTRSRNYITAQHGGSDLSLDERNKISESRTCNSGGCPVNGYMSPWGEWSACTKECGGGTQTRNRIYTPAVNGGADLSLDDYNNFVSEIRSCNISPCAVKHSKILDNGSKYATSFTVLSPNGQYKLYWNGKYWFVVYEKTETGTWSIWAQIIINSKLIPTGFHAGRYGIFIANEWSTKQLAYTDSEVLYSAIGDNGEWFLVKKDGSTEPILKYNQKKEISW